MKYRVINNEVFDLENNNPVNLTDFANYVISIIKLDNYHNLFDEYDLPLSYAKNSHYCDQCGNTNYERDGELFGISYFYSSGCYGDDFLVGVETNEELQSWLLQLYEGGYIKNEKILEISRELGDIDYESADEVWVV